MKKKKRLLRKIVSPEQYTKTMDFIINQGLPVNETLVKMLEYADTVTIKKRSNK